MIETSNIDASRYLRGSKIPHMDVDRYGSSKFMMYHCNGQFATSCNKMQNS